MPTRACIQAVEAARLVFCGPADESVLLALDLAMAVLWRCRAKAQHLKHGSAQLLLRQLSDELQECCGKSRTMARLARRRVAGRAELLSLLDSSIRNLAFVRAGMAEKAEDEPLFGGEED